jgi:two-component system, cell cycle sensor histidine kinase and response regulator CckA
VRPFFTPAKLAIAYVVIAAAWIVGSDSVVSAIGGNRANSIQSVKGMLFVLLTGMLLYSWARRFQWETRKQTLALREAHQRSESERRLYATLSAVNRRIIKPATEAGLHQSICDALINPGKFQCAWIGRIVNEGRAVTCIASAGGEPDREISLTVPLTGDDAGLALRQAVQLNCTANRPSLPPNDRGLGRLAQHCEARSCVVLPIRRSLTERLVLMVFAGQPAAFGAGTMEMFDELTCDLEHGLQVITDREQRIQVEAALRASEERYRLLAENSHDVIWILSPDGKLRYISPSIQRLLGYSPAEMLTLDFHQYFAPSSYDRVMQELEAMRLERSATGRIQSRLLEVEQIRIDGSHVWTEVHAAELNDDEGRWIGLLGDTRDITERRAAAQAIASEISRCRALLEASMDGIHITDPNGRLIDANEIFLRDRGYTRPMVPSLHIANWDAKLSRSEIRHRLATIDVEPTLFETLHRRANGATFPVEIWAKRVVMDGRTVFYCTARDVTERKGLEQRLLRAQRLESIGLIASGIAHDLNNVLTPILLSTGLLEMRYGAPEDRALLDPIEAAARRGSNIVQQILTFARGAEGQRVAITPKVLLKELSTLIRETFPRNITHRLEVAPDAQSLNGDPTQLHQVFLNLAVNARDAMPEGGALTIDVRNRTIVEDDLRSMPSAHAGDYVCITVSDSGSGMSADVLDHLFEPFFTTKPRGRGTGLGLSTVHGLVRSHGGFVDVNSRLGHGSEFRVFLPAASSAAPPQPIALPTQRPQIGHGEYVLIADDEPAILTVAESVLRRHGFVVLTAADGQQALAQYERHAAKIAIVVTDVMMPIFDGTRLAAEIRQRNATVPIVAMSGLMTPASGDDGRQQLRALGVTTIIDKPYGEAELLRAIEAALPLDSVTAPRS